MMNKTILGTFVAAFAVLAAPVSVGVASAPIMQHPIAPIRTPDGRVVRGPHNSLTSGNWSGYAVAQYQTGQTYTSAQGQWIVPAVSGTPAPGYSSSWVGIGGFCLNARCTRVDNSLIQLGTEQDVSAAGTASYYAWYEMLPAAETIIPSSVFPVNPGDQIVASLQLLPAADPVIHSKNGGTHGGHSSGGTTSSQWLLTLTNVTQNNATWSLRVNYNSSLASAEWIEEAPYQGGILPLADYGTATFDPNYANGAAPGLTSSESITMVDSQKTQTEVSVPSLPDSEADGFSTCWGTSLSTTSCARPGS